MKQSKTADFNDVSFRASYKDSVLVSLEVSFLEEGFSGRLLTAKEVLELHDWLNDDVLALGAVQPSIIAPLASWGVPVGSSAVGSPSLEDRGLVGAKVGTPGRMTDAQSVANRVPLAVELKASGMILDSRDVSIPVTVPHNGK